jgi:hypothetical protein
MRSEFFRYTAADAWFLPQSAHPDTLRNLYGHFFYVFIFHQTATDLALPALTGVYGVGRTYQCSG